MSNEEMMNVKGGVAFGVFLVRCLIQIVTRYIRW